jgi:GT2 family glycosyltransferase
VNANTQPQVSVVIASFERPHFLAASVESVLAQSHSDLELIVADDGSGEATRELLRGFTRDPRLRILWLEHCGRPAAVRNAGIRAARGRHVAFQDSDDLWLPDKLERQLAALAANPAARWCYTACSHIDERGVAMAPAGVAAWVAHQGNILDAVACLRAHSALPTVLVERELLARAGGFDEQLALYEDHDLWLRLAALSEVAVVAQPLVKVRRHAQHYSGHDELAAAECRAIFLERAGRHGLSPPASAELRRLRVLHAARLARLRARAGNGSAARHCLRDSVGDGWRYPRWWIDAARVLLGPA